MDGLYTVAQFPDPEILVFKNQIRRLEDGAFEGVEGHVQLLFALPPSFIDYIVPYLLNGSHPGDVVTMRDSLQIEKEVVAALERGCSLECRPLAEPPVLDPQRSSVDEVLGDIHDHPVAGSEAAGSVLSGGEGVMHPEVWLCMLQSK